MGYSVTKTLGGEKGKMKVTEGKKDGKVKIVMETKTKEERKTLSKIKMGQTIRLEHFRDDGKKRIVEFVIQ